MHAHTDGEYEMPSAEALLAGTLALMTGHAQSANPCQRHQMAQKIGCNLNSLAQHPALSSNFKAVVERVRPHWAVMGQSVGDTLTGHTIDTHHPWHATATRLQ